MPHIDAEVLGLMALPAEIDGLKRRLIEAFAGIVGPVMCSEVHVYLEFRPVVLGVGPTIAQKRALGKAVTKIMAIFLDREPAPKDHLQVVFLFTPTDERETLAGRLADARYNLLQRERTLESVAHEPEMAAEIEHEIRALRTQVTLLETMTRQTQS